VQLRRNGLLLAGVVRAADAAVRRHQADGTERRGGRGGKGLDVRQTPDVARVVRAKHPMRPRLGDKPLVVNHGLQVVALVRLRTAKPRAT
jgi:hypothetical protein